jgi:hypothetical protein
MPIREFAITLHFAMHDYDYQQDGDRLADYLRRIVESYADTDAQPVTVRTERGADIDEDASPIPTDPAAIVAAIREQAAREYHCSQCGQHITDGKPCDCGARNR